MTHRLTQEFPMDHAARTQRLGKISSQPQAGHLTTTSCGRISSAATGMHTPHLQHVNAGLGDLLRRLVKVWLLRSKTVEAFSGMDQKPTAATLRIGSNFLNNDMGLWTIAKFQRQRTFAVAERQRSHPIGAKLANAMNGKERAPDRDGGVNARLAAIVKHQCGGPGLFNMVSHCQLSLGWHPGTNRCAR